MEWYFWVAIALLGLVILSLLPLKVGMRMYWNVGKNLGVLSIDIWGISVNSMQIEITQTAINIIKSKKKDRQIQLQALSFGAVFAHHFLQAIFRYMSIREVNMFVDLSKKNDAFAAAMMNGVVLQFLYAIFAVLYGLKGNFLTFMSVNNDIGENKCSVTNYASVMLAPVILLVCAVRAFLRTKKGIMKYERFSR